MKYLLDTHTFIWSISKRESLSRNSINVIESSENEIYVSAITFWEISLKVSVGKLKSINSDPKYLPGIALQAGFNIIPLTANETSTYHLLQSTWHKDPFDRMLIWQAINQDLTLISKDERVRQYTSSGSKVLW